jgi:hypothetical protein
MRYLGLYLGLACLAGSLAMPLQTKDDEINWLGNYRESLQQARQSRKPILVEFRCEA